MGAGGGGGLPCHCLPAYHTWRRDSTWHACTIPHLQLPASHPPAWDLRLVLPAWPHHTSACLPKVGSLPCHLLWLLPKTHCLHSARTLRYYRLPPPSLSQVQLHWIYSALFPRKRAPSGQHTCTSLLLTTFGTRRREDLTCCLPVLLSPTLFCASTSTTSLLHLTTVYLLPLPHPATCSPPASTPLCPLPPHLGMLAVWMGGGDRRQADDMGN